MRRFGNLQKLELIGEKSQEKFTLDYVNLSVTQKLHKCHRNKK